MEECHSLMIMSKLLAMVTAKHFSSLLLALSTSKNLGFWHWLQQKALALGYIQKFEPYCCQFSPSQYGMSGSARRRVTFLAQGRGPTWWRLYNLVQTREQLKEKEDFWGMKGENGCTGQGREFVVTITLKITNHQVHPLLPILVVLNAHLKWENSIEFVLFDLSYNFPQDMIEQGTL